MNYIIGAFKPPCDIFVTFSDERPRKQVQIKKDNGKNVMVSIAPVPGKRLDHTGVKIELLGQIELYFDRGNFYDFTSLGSIHTVRCGEAVEAALPTVKVATMVPMVQGPPPSHARRLQAAEGCWFGQDRCS